MRGGTSHVKISCESAPLPQLTIVSDAVHVAKQGNAHVPL
jgi:hypothetical protein